MSQHFLETSPLVKHYHPEAGTPKVDLPLDEPRRSKPGSLLFDAVQVFLAAEEKLSADHYRGGVHRVIQLVGSQHLELVPSLQNERRAIAIDKINSAGRSDRRSVKLGHAGQALGR